MSADIDVDALLDSPSESALARERALPLRDLTDVELPPMSVWNYAGCRHHPEPDPYCEFRACGGAPWRHQRTGATWLYVARSGLVLDETGMGKAGTIITLTALLRERDELERAIIVTLPSLINDPWLTDFRRFTPMLKVVPAVGTVKERQRLYRRGNWDVLVIGFPLMLRDQKYLEQLAPTLLVSDDVQPLTHLDTKTWEAFGELSHRAERVVNMNATPVSLRLHDIYALGTSVGIREVLGSLRAFEGRYVRSEVIPITISGKKKGTRRVIKKRVTKGYHNLGEFKETVKPFYIRRTIDDADDIGMPEVLPAATIWLDMHPEQRRRYEDLRKGVIELKRSGDVKYVDALQRFGYGQRICAGLPALGEPDGPEASIKLDWFEHAITNDWATEKVVCFVVNRGTVEALTARMASHGIGVAMFWGTEGTTQQRLDYRKSQEQRFWQEPECRVAVGTTSMERGANLQVARIGVNLDSLLNPQRMIQILGRIKRAGSKHRHVLPVNLFCRDSQESSYLDVLRTRAALPDYLFDSENELYEKLDAVSLLDLIAS